MNTFLEEVFWMLSETYVEMQQLDLRGLPFSIIQDGFLHIFFAFETFQLATYGKSPSSDRQIVIKTPRPIKLQ